MARPETPDVHRFSVEGIRPPGTVCLAVLLLFLCEGAAFGEQDPAEEPDAVEEAEGAEEPEAVDEAETGGEVDSSGEADSGEEIEGGEESDPGEQSGARATEPVADENLDELVELPDSVEEEGLLPELPEGVLLPDWGDEDREGSGEILDGLVEELEVDPRADTWGVPRSDFDRGWIGTVAPDLINQDLRLAAGSNPLDRQGFRFGLGVQANYDSNVRASEDDEQGEFYLAVRPVVEYRSAPAGVPGVVMARYSPNIRYYPGDSSLDTVDHSALASISYDGVRGQTLLTATYDNFTGVNQSTSGLSERDALRVNFDGLYELTDLFSVYVDASYDETQKDGEDDSSFNNQTWIGRITGRRRISQEFWIGPSFQWSLADSDSLGETESFRYTVAAGYKPAALDYFSIRGDLGYETYDNDSEDAGSGNNLTGELEVIYNPAERVSFAAEIEYSAVNGTSRDGISGSSGSGEWTGELRATYSPNDVWNIQGRVRTNVFGSNINEGESVEETFATLTLTRAFGNSAADLGLIYRNRDYSREAPGVDSREGDTATTVFLRYTRALLGGKAAFVSSVQWTDNSGENDWERYQASSGLTIQF